MDTKDLCEHTKIRLIAAAVGHQQCTKTESNIIPLPGTDRVIAIGTPTRVRELLVADISAVEQPATGLEGENELISMARMKQIRAAIRQQDGMDGDDWDFALANAVAAHLARQAQADPAAPEQVESTIPEPGFSDSLADRVFNMPCKWKGDERDHAAVLLGHTMACEQAYKMIYAYLARQSQQAERAATDDRTYMDDKQAHEWAWAQVKRDVGTNGWTTGEHCNYFGFFLHGWRYGRQYERQGTTAAPASQEGAHAALEEVRKVEPIECWSHNEEDFNAGSLDELLCNHDDLKPGDTVWVGEAVHPDPAKLVNEDSIIENIGEAAYDIAGEHAEDYPSVSDEQAKELEGLVADWIKRTCPPTFYTVENIKPYVLSNEDFPHDPGALKTPASAERSGD